ncbi:MULTISPECIES: diguanylate cyclase [Halomonadaceae]|jgi:diguanylate cyclase (GGDEF)-like protein|uniref:diguanylate cyclase n=1 Tax=Vreelandella piezotolerans TaxID=2609667 RepID=A0ABQ6X9Z7_9GAMM|nr:MULTISPECIES: diguanylate cyclase [Halomonas]KAE8438824.1 diguanylate cyclase [Halomonas piezotolerans]MCG7590316.1 diguanylate cyclase [Halomonas sp. McD50-5]MCG7616428.1 diguanylate cyclase [Halomonas sp. McD50-4]QJA25381.1 diguanylate cyclase [Halomonas piezotolerans]BCB60003.1 diguanylate cyclase [Halomonas sp. A020]
MSSSASSLHDKLNQLRQRFIDQLPARLQLTVGLWQQSQASAEAQARLGPELHRFFHSLKGTGRSLGFERIALLAEQGEAALDGQAPAGQVVEQVFVHLAEEQQRLQSLPEQQRALAAMTSVEFSPKPVQTRSKRQRLIYLCDDEPDQVSQLLHHLRCFGHEVVHFEDTDTFFNAVITRRPDAIIMDVQFPQGNTAGTETLASLNKLTGEPLPSIVLSAHGDFHSRLSAVRAGCNGYFTKPVKPLDLMLAVDELTTPSDEEPLRILIVDDEPEVAAYHALLLEQAGMAVQQVNHPADALTALERFSPDLLLVDVYMPVCSGEELANIIRQQPEHVGLPIIYLSSETDSQKQLSAMTAGVEAFITKPVIPDELVSAVTLRAERLRLLRSLMTRDSMTGLYNHSTTTELISKALAQAHRDNTEHAMAMIDIDHFKAVNDTHGHLAGDQVIITLARLLKTRLRMSDIIGRYGGEEFVVLLKGVSDERACELIDALRHDFAQVDFHAGGTRFRCTFSAGISRFPNHPSTESLRLSADQALYRAKHQGRNQVVTSTEQDDDGLPTDCP